MKMAMAEVYEVATFYHHFDVVKEGDMRLRRHGARLRFDCLRARRIARAAEDLAGDARTDVRVLHAPCVGRCDTAPSRSSARIRCRTRPLKRLPRSSALAPSRILVRRARDASPHRLQGVPRGGGYALARRASAADERRRTSSR